MAAKAVVRHSLQVAAVTWNTLIGRYVALLHAMSAELHKRTNKQHKYTHKTSQSCSNLTCGTDTGIMLKNLTLQDTSAASSMYMDMFSVTNHHVLY